MSDEKPIESLSRQNILAELQTQEARKGKVNTALQYGEDRDKARDVAPYTPELGSKTAAENITEKLVTKKYKEGASEYFDDLKKGKIKPPETFEEHLEKYRYGYYSGDPEIVDELEGMRRSQTDTAEQLITRKAERMSENTNEATKSLAWLNHPDNQNPQTTADFLEQVQHEVKAGRVNLDETRKNLYYRSDANISDEDIIYELAQQRYGQSRKKKTATPTG